MRVMPALRLSMARLDGADTAARNGIPAARVLFTISYDTRPLTVRHFGLRQKLVVKQVTTTLSTALWRPISLAYGEQPALNIKAPAACVPPACLKSSCTAATASNIFDTSSPFSNAEFCTGCFRHPRWFYHKCRTTTRPRSHCACWRSLCDQRRRYANVYGADVSFGVLPVISILAARVYLLSRLR